MTPLAPASNNTNNSPITLAMTGASGCCYGLRLLECLVKADKTVYFIISKAARVVLAQETSLKLPSKRPLMQSYLIDYCNAKGDQIKVFELEQWLAPVASGSGPSIPMVIVPASMGCISAICHGASNNLIERAADVQLKERRPLILVPRETPYSALHLENMLKLTQMGAVIMPASPGFYRKPTQINDLVDFMVARILDHLGIDQSLIPRWGDNSVHD